MFLTSPQNAQPFIVKFFELEDDAASRARGCVGVVREAGGARERAGLTAAAGASPLASPAVFSLHSAWCPGLPAEEKWVTRKPDLKSLPLTRPRVGDLHCNSAPRGSQRTPAGPVPHARSARSLDQVTVVGCQVRPLRAPSGPSCTPSCGRPCVCCENGASGECDSPASRTTKINHFQNMEGGLRTGQCGVGCGEGGERVFRATDLPLHIIVKPSRFKPTRRRAGTRGCSTVHRGSPNRGQRSVRRRTARPCGGGNVRT